MTTTTTTTTHPSAGGVWWVVPAGCDFRDDTERTTQIQLRHVPSGLILGLPAHQRLLYEADDGHHYFDYRYCSTIDGYQTVMVNQAPNDRSDWVVLPPDLVPATVQDVATVGSAIRHPDKKTGSHKGTTFEHGNNSSSSGTDPTTAVAVLDDSVDCRPVGTLAGGTWFRCPDATTTNNDDTSSYRLVYREAPGRYYTRDGRQVHDVRDELLCAVNSDMTTTTIRTTTAPQNDKPTTQTLVVQGPAGTRPGGRWFTQSYHGPVSKQTQTMAFVTGHVLAGMMFGSSIDQRYLYQEPVHNNNNKTVGSFYTMEGVRLQRLQSLPKPMPRTFCPLGMVSVCTTVEQEATGGPSSSSDQKDDDENGTATPPGWPAGGLWYRRTRNGVHDFVYRPDPKKTPVVLVNRRGEIINDPHRGVFQPPIT